MVAAMLGLRYPSGSDPADEPAVLPGGLCDVWRDKPVGEIDDDLIFAVVEDARRRGMPGMRTRGGASEARAGKLYNALSTLFQWLWERRRVKVNPCRAVKRPAAGAARSRVLSDDEMRWLWRACDAAGYPFGPLVQLLLLTGCRLNEVAGMRREEIQRDEDGSFWLIPCERCKNHREHLLPLAATTLRLIVAMPRVENRAGLVFTIGGKALTAFSRSKARLDREMLRVARQERGEGFELQPWRIHDLRRTAATGMAGIGVQPHVVEAVLNHVSGARAGVAGTYNRYSYRAEKAEALARWATKVATFTADQDKVI